MSHNRHEDDALIDMYSREAQLGLLETIIGEHPNGIPVSEIERHFRERSGSRVTRRTLQRRLKSLVDTHRAKVAGEHRGAVYVPVQALAPEAAAAEAVAADSGVIHRAPLTLGPASERLRELVRQPSSAKKRVGYDASLLESYVPGKTWYLDEAARRRLHSRGRAYHETQPAGTFARAVLDRLLIDLSWASSHLEGNTYSLLDTRNLIEFGQQAEGRSAEETHMILNHKKAIELLAGGADEVGFNRYTFLNLHATLSVNLLANPDDEGKLRSKPVDITGSVYVPLAIPQRIEALFDHILQTCASIADPFEQAFFIMVHIPYLQPFMDCNKRLSRMGANVPLIRENLKPLSFIDVPTQRYIEATLAVYEFRDVDYLRDVFLWAYERSCEQYAVIRDSMVEPDPLRLKYRDEIAEFVRLMVRRQLPPREHHVREFMATRMPEGEKESSAVIHILQKELMMLHEGNFARYGIRPGEYEGWSQAVRVR